ncbi:MAG: hypothetical protein CMJ49_06270 [Planctomycetaceae bacterium]|nr:hypothetical protein [Planctomycetaceae bacterium]
MIAICIYLLAGLVFHKALWEVLKRRGRGAGRTNERKSLTAWAAWGVKLGILLGIVAQTVWVGGERYFLRIADDGTVLHGVGLVIYTLGLALAVAGRLQLGDNWSDIEAGDIQQKHNVVDRGVYRFIRHPIYMGDLLLLAGLEAALNSWLIVGVALLTPVVMWKAMQEEKGLMTSVNGYADYAKRTRRFVPWVF